MFNPVAISGRLRHFRDLGRLCLALALAAIFFPACSGSPEPPQSKPIILSVLYDISRSARPLPALDEALLKEFTLPIQRGGGTLALSFIGECDESRMLRLDLNAVSGKLDQRAHLRMRNVRLVTAWIPDTSHNLIPKRDVGVTDINGALARMELFYSDPSLPIGANRLLLVISDGIHTTRCHRQEHVKFDDDVKVATVGMDRARARELFGARVAVFSDVDQALAYLTGPQSQEVIR